MMRDLVRAAIEPPVPGLADRVLAGVAERREQRQEAGAHWAFNLVAAALAAALVITLVVGTRLARQSTVPGAQSAATPSRGAVVPIAGSAVRPFLTSAAGGWLAEQTGGRTTLYQTADLGRTWTPRLTYRGAPPVQVVVDGSGAGVLVGGRPDQATGGMLLFRTGDGGVTWQRMAAPEGVPAWGLPSFADARRGWMLASLGAGRAQVLSTTDGGRTWTESSPFNDRANFPGVSSVQLRILWTSDGRGLVVPPLGAGTMPLHVFVTDDGGATWRSSVPAVPAGQDVTAGNGLLDARVLPDGRGTLFLQPVDAQVRGTALYAYTTADAGRRWSQPVRLDGQAPPGTPRALFALDEGHWWASSGSGADLLVTADGGRTVQRRNGVLPAGYAFQSLGFWSASEGWAVVAAGGRTGILVTQDAGAHWHPLTPPS